MKSTKCHDRGYFCDTLDEIMLVREAVEFNSSMEQNNVREFYMAFMVSRFDAKLDVFKNVFVPQCQNFNSNMPLPRSAVVSDCR